MPIAFWRDEYCTGNPMVDAQHRHLFVIVNKLHDAMLEGHGADVLTQTLDELVHYTVEHFRDEEKLMRDNNYPEYAKHKEMHESITKDVLALLEKQKQHKQFLSIEVSKFLTSWLIHHIKGEDKRMIAFFRAQSEVV